MNIRFNSLNGKMKRKFAILCIIISVICQSAAVTNAATPGFAFNVYAYSTPTQWTDNYYGNVNAKAYANQSWTLRIDTISFSQTVNTNGMAYALFLNNTKKTPIAWRISTGKTWNSWNSGAGLAGYSYNLKARLDTDQAGYCISNGIYNADII